MIETPRQLEEHVSKLAKQRENEPQRKIIVSAGTCGIAAGAAPVLDAICAEVASQGLEQEVSVLRSGCMGLCHSEPSVEVLDAQTGQAIMYGEVTADQASAIVAAATNPADGVSQVPRTWYYPEEEDASESCPQARIVLRNSGRIDPESIEDYLVRDGYRALSKALCEMSSDDVISVVDASGLRGRGGGGFPTGRKWRFAANQDSETKYIICNADEGDPGAFMDRAVLEGDPHAVIEAMAIGGYAIGASEGIIYIRAEYPLAIERLEIAIAQAREQGFLGENILGSGFNFDLKLRYGAGAFVCGEETALIHSIQGERGMPTFKPPFPAIEGLRRKPTIVNNVETFANIGPIIRNGADWFRGIGTEGSPGTKVFALAGKISKVGLIEVPMGTTLRSIIFEVGNGIDGGKEFKAVQTGGPSGGCIPASELDTPIDYDTLKALGSMMGSGGMIVMDEDDCMIDVAKFFLDFTLDESCGKCTPCRIGGTQMFKILERIANGNGQEEDLDLLKDLAHTVKTASLCGLGMTSANPVLATINRFEDEYVEHIRDKHCRAGKCKDLLTYEIDPEKCVGCTLCARSCPVKCITGKPREKHVIDQDECIRCGECYRSCKFEAIIRK